MPVLRPIKAMHADLHDRINRMVRGLEGDRERVAGLVERIGERKNGFKAMLRAAREDVIGAVEGYFREVEEKF